STLNGVSDVAHQGLVIKKIMYRVEAGRQNLAALVQVPQIGAAVVPAGIAAAVRVQRSRVVSVARIADTHEPFARIQEPGAGVTRRQNAIEHVDAPSHG